MALDALLVNLAEWLADVIERIATAEALAAEDEGLGQGWTAPVTLPNLPVSAGAAVELCGLHPTLVLMPMCC